MAAGESKGGSDLDVFEGLGKKNSTRAPANAPRASAPPPPPSLRQAELPKQPASLGFPAPTPQPGAPPPALTATLPSNSNVAAVPAPRTAPPPPPPIRATLPPVVAPPSKAAPASAAPAMNVKALASSPPPPAVPAGKPSHGTGALDMDWDEDEEATHVLDREGSKADAAPGANGAAPPPAAGVRPPPAPSAKQTLVGLSSSPPPAAPSARPPSLPPPPPSAAQPYARPPAAPPAAAAPPPASIRPAVPAPSVPPPAMAPGAMSPPSNGAANSFPYQQNTSPMAMPPRVVSARSPTIEDAPALPPMARSRMMEATAVVRPQARPTGLIAAAGISVVVLVGAVFFLMPRSGQIAVNVADARGSAVKNLQVSVDGKLQCDTAPCIIHNLSTGSHTVKVEATGFDPPADKAVAVESGKDTTVDFTLSLMSAAGGTGIKVTGTQPGEKLYVDDREIGALPQELHDMTPGTHRVRVAGGERYAAVEKTVTIAKDDFQDLGAVTLKVVKGRATVSLSTPGAKVYLVSGSDRRELPTLPMSIDLDPSKQWSLVATKAGYNDFTQPLSFDDGQAEKSFVVSLDPKTASATGASMTFSPPPVAFNPQPSQPATPPPAVQHTAPPAPAPHESGGSSGSTAGGEGTLNLNSIPASSVVLDGKPIGTTPQIGITVPAGTHTVVFVNAEQGFKKQVSVTVAAGETKKVHP